MAGDRASAAKVLAESWRRLAAGEDVAEVERRGKAALALVRLEQALAELAQMDGSAHGGWSGAELEALRARVLMRLDRLAAARETKGVAAGDDPAGDRGAAAGVAGTCGHGADAAGRSMA
ncbi:MAG: hypothetical protein ACK47T_08825, partial [Brevundimonas sp.]